MRVKRLTLEGEEKWKPCLWGLIHQGEACGQGARGSRGAQLAHLAIRASSGFGRIGVAKNLCLLGDT